MCLHQAQIPVPTPTLTSPSPDSNHDSNPDQDRESGTKLSDSLNPDGGRSNTNASSKQVIMPPSTVALTLVVTLGMRICPEA